MVLNNMSSETIQDFEDSSDNSYKYQNVMLFKDIFDRTLFHENFDAWTVHEQYTWINKNFIKFFPNIPPSLATNISGCFQPPDFRRPLTEPPEWLDIEKYNRGQKFVRDNYAIIIITMLIGILYDYVFNEDLKIIIMSGYADTPYLGFKRFMATVRHIFSWLYGQPWVEGTDANRSMQHANRMHSLTRQKFCQFSNEQIDNAARIKKPFLRQYRELLLKDFANTCPFAKFGQYPPNLAAWKDSKYQPRGLNNCNIAHTQACLMGLILIHPDHFGVHKASDENLEAFCHMWKCYGYFLGLPDEYNICRGSLEDVKQRVHDLFHYLIIPNLRDITPEWEHMTRCLIESLNYYPLTYLPYKAMVLIATDMFELSMPHLHGSLSYLEWAAYKVWTFLLRYLMRLSSFRIIFNMVVQKLFWKGTNLTSEKHEELQRKSEEQLSNFAEGY